MWEAGGGGGRGGQCALKDPEWVQDRGTVGLSELVPGERGA